MSYTTHSSQPAGDHCRRLLSDLEGGSPVREEFATALKEAISAFADQVSEPDALKFIVACKRFARFLEKQISLEESEQKSVIQVIQIAFAVNENAINNSMLTPEQRKAHERAKPALMPICSSVLQDELFTKENWGIVFDLAFRLYDAIVKQARDIDVTVPTKGRGRVFVAPPPTPCVSEFDVMNMDAPSRDVVDIGLIAHPMFLERALRLSNSPSKAARLGRPRSMPALPQTASPRSTRTGLSAVQETDE